MECLLPQFKPSTAWKRGCRCERCVAARRATKRADYDAMRADPARLARCLATNRRHSRNCWRRKNGWGRHEIETVRKGKGWISAGLRRKGCQQAVNYIKLARGCADCGYHKDAVALDFDHIDPAAKTANVSSLACEQPIGEVMKEIAKCEVVCANCHRVRTFRGGPQVSKKATEWTSSFTKPR